MKSVSDKRSRGLRLAGAALALGGCALVAAGFHRESALLVVAGAAALAFGLAALWRAAAFASVLAATAFVALAAAEMVLRDGGQPTAPTRFSASYSGGRYFARSDLGVQPKPGVHAIAKTAADGATIYDVKYTIGADGFRVTPGAATPGARRINFFGCSFTFGEGIEDDQTLPHHVARQGGFAVKNFGFHGWGAHQALAILTSERDTAGAVNFFLVIPWQAERSACAPAWTVGSPRYVLEGGEPKRAGDCRPEGAGGLVSRMLAGSAVARRVDDALALRARRDSWMALYLALLGQMHEISKQRSQEFVVGYVRADWSWNYGSHTDDSVMAALRAKGIRVIDLSLADARRPIAPAHVVHALDGHPSGAANEARARLIVQALR